MGVKVLSATVSERAGRWFISLQVEVELPDLPPEGERTEVVGVDLGVTKLATLSDGVTIDKPKALHTDLRKVKRLQRMVSQRRRGASTGARLYSNWPRRTCAWPTSGRTHSIR